MLASFHLFFLYLGEYHPRSSHQSIKSSEDKMLCKSIFALALAPVVLAHFNLEYPSTRGFDEDKESTGPCGGFDTVSSQRADFPISGAPIQLKLGHQQTNLAVYLAVGDNPGNGFSVVLHPQIQESGFGEFCLGDVSIPSNLNVTDGTKATIQVITNAHGEGGLYQVCTETEYDHLTQLTHD